MPWYFGKYQGISSLPIWIYLFYLLTKSLLFKAVSMNALTWSGLAFLLKSLYSVIRSLYGSADTPVFVFFGLN